MLFHSVRETDTLCSAAMATGPSTVACKLGTKVVCIGRNYADHAAELGNKIPKEPVVFIKPLSRCA